MEEKNLYNIDDELLRSKFDEAQETPSGLVWENIEQQLDRPNKKPIIFWLGALLLLLTIAIAVWYFAKDKNKTIATTENKKSHSSFENADKQNDNSTQPDNNKVTKKNEGIDDVTKEEKAVDSNTKIEKGKDENIKRRNNDMADNVMPDSTKLSKNNLNKNADDKSLISNNGVNDISGGLLFKNDNKNKKKPFVTTDKLQSPKPGNELQSKKQIQISNAEVNSSAKSVDSSVTFLIKPMQIDSFKNAQVSNNVTIIKDTSFIIQDTLVTTVNSKDSATKIVKNNKPKSIKPAPSLSFFISPSFESNSFSSNGGYDFLKEQTVATISLGANYNLPLSSKLSLSTGIKYYKLKHKLADQAITFNRFITEPYVFYSSIGEMPVAPATMRDGFSPPSPVFPTQFSIKYNYTYSLNFIDIPLEVVYKLNNNKFKVSILAGLHLQFLLSQKSVLNLIKERTINTLTYNNMDVTKFSTAGSVGANCMYPLNKKISFLFAPQLQYNFGKLNKGGIIAAKQNFLNFFAGINMKF